MKIILFNGPPRCGKDTAGELLRELVDGPHFITKFAKPVKEGVHKSLGLNVPYDYFEHVKDEAVEEFHYQVPRKAYISYSEDYMKPNFGNDIFGKLTRNEIHSRIGQDPWTDVDNYIVGITDSGFVEEAQVLIDWIGSRNVVLVHLHREGCSFEGDSRSHLDLPVRTMAYNNDGTVEDLKNFVRIVLNSTGVKVHDAPNSIP